MSESRIQSKIRTLLVGRADRVSGGDLSERTPLQMVVRGEAFAARIYPRYNGSLVLALEMYVDEVELHPRATHWVATRSGVMPYCTLQIDRRRRDGSAKLVVTHTLVASEVNGQMLDEVIDAMVYWTRQSRRRIAEIVEAIYSHQPISDRHLHGEESESDSAAEPASSAEEVEAEDEESADEEEYDSDDYGTDEGDSDDYGTEEPGADDGSGYQADAHTPSRRNRTDASGLGGEDIMERLRGLVGLAPVKDLMSGLKAVHEFDQRRAEVGLPSVAPSPHLVFTGNPGTGKTTVARLVGDLYRSLGLLTSGHLIETSRADLVASYLGQTARKTRKVCQSALGGVLFIDEAYTLSQGHHADYGAEAIAELLTFMENHRGEFAVIVAGYPEEMQGFLDSNPGLRNRFDEVVHFPDYGDAELLSIFTGLLEEKQFAITDEAVTKLTGLIAAMERGRGFSNARAIRQLFTQVTLTHARQMARQGRTDQLNVISAVAIPELAPQQNEPTVPQGGRSLSGAHGYL
jgi:hypothetical protein